MSEEEFMQLFLKECLTEKEKLHFSTPMNTHHQKQFAAFKQGVILGLSLNQ